MYHHVVKTLELSILTFVNEHKKKGGVSQNNYSVKYDGIWVPLLYPQLTKNLLFPEEINVLNCKHSEDDKIHSFCTFH